MFRRQALSIGLLAAASLLFESTLTRLLAVTQFYHFAFLVVSLALLGYGTSGTILAVFPSLRKRSLNQILLFGAGSFFCSVGLAYGVVNFLPFDSYSIAWDQRQIFFFMIFYLALTLPFTASGLATGAAITASTGKSHLVYAANLLGSGLGVILAPLTLSLAGVPGAVLLSVVIGLLGVFPLLPSKKSTDKPFKFIRAITTSTTVIFLIGFTILTLLNFSSHAPLGMILSPYKGLAQANRFPEAENIFSRWNAISRVDILQNAGVHHLPGLSYDYQGNVPSQLGLFLDGDSPQPITLVSPDSFPAAEYLPENIGFELRPDAKVLVIEPGGGLGILQTLANGAREVTVVMGNPLEQYAVQQNSGEFNIFSHPHVNTVFETGRVFFANNDQRFDVIFYPLTDDYRPVSSGVYSLAEDFLLTVDSFTAALEHLSPGGILITTRWLQIPPSESVRLTATLVEALEKNGIHNAKDTFVLYRGIQTMTMFVKPSRWTPDELIKIRAFTNERKFDLVWAPDIHEDEINQYNRLPEPVYYQNIHTLLEAGNRLAYYESYPFDIKPATDDKPFFFHFFKWEQTPEVLSTFGHIWQPFGGSGYLVTFALLILVVLFSLLLILLPLFFQHTNVDNKFSQLQRWKLLFYFAFLGIGFMFMEIPIIQRSILYLGHPIVAFTVVVFSILVFSSIGSSLVRHKGIQPIVFLLALVVLAFIYSPIQMRLINATLGWNLTYRILISVILIVPLAVTMGMPFPLGLIVIEKTGSDIVPWVWAVNGSTSVMASVLAAILVLTYGFSVVLFLGAVMYTGALLLFFFGFKFILASENKGS